MSIDINKTIHEAPLHKSMASLARSLNINVYMLKYHLAKARRLELVKAVVKLNVTPGKPRKKRVRDEVQKD